MDRGADRIHLLTTHRLFGWLLLAAAGWTTFVWVNRLVNLARDDRSAAFVAVHVVIAVVSLALAVPVAIVGWRLRAAARREER